MFWGRRKKQVDANAPCEWWQNLAKLFSCRWMDGILPFFSKKMTQCMKTKQLWKVVRPKKRQVSVSENNDSLSTEQFVFLNNARVEALSKRYVLKNMEKSTQWALSLGGTSAISISMTTKFLKIYLHLLITLFFANGLVFSLWKSGKRMALNSLLRWFIFCLLGFSDICNRRMPQVLIL